MRIWPAVVVSCAFTSVGWSEIDPLLATSRGLAGRNTGSPHAVYLSVDQVANLNTTQVERSIDQVRRIWNAAGVEITAGRYSQRPAAGAVIVSVRLVGARERALSGAPALGWVHLSATGRPIPMVFVSVPAVSDLLSEASLEGRSFTQRPQALRDALVAQAVGRIIAHELGHYLRQHGRHDSRGLLRPHYSANELLGRWLRPFEVSAGDKPVVRLALAALLRLQSDPP